MTHLKKSLALLLAFVMIFSSMTVAASAWSVGDDGRTVTFQIKFFRQDSKTGNWIETKNAAPGEKVKARMYIDTDYYAYSGELALLFDSRFFDNPDFGDGVLRSLVTNNDYLGGALSLYTADTAIWRSDETKFPQNRVSETFPNGRLVDSGIIPADYFDDFDMIFTALKFGGSSGCTKLVGDDWVVEFDLRVRDDYDYTKVINTEGSARVPEELTSSSAKSLNDIIINVPQGPAGSKTENIIPMMNWEPIVNTTPGTLTTTSKVILDGNGGKFSNDSYTRDLPGIINTSCTGLYDAANLPTRPGYYFTGWSAFDVLPSEGQALTDSVLDSINYSNLTEAEIAALGWTLTPAMCQNIEDSYGISYEPGTEITSGQVKLLNLKSKSAAELNALGCTVNANIIDKLKDTSALTYQHEFQTLYAQWEKESAGKIHYTNKVYVQRIDDETKYDLINNKTVYAEAGTVINNPEFPMEGFTFNSALSDRSVTVSSDNDSVLRSYYDRNKYTLTYAFTDESGDQTETYDVRYGAELPECVPYPNAPHKEGHHFVEWRWGEDSKPATMPATDVTLTPKYDINTYQFIFNAAEGVFANGNRTKSFVYEYDQVPSLPDVPTAPGKKFLEWESEDGEWPDKVSQNMTFTAIYNDIQYNVTFMDGDTPIKDGSYTAYYGDVITEGNIPIDYSASKWALEDGTVVSFPYTVTGDVTLYSVEGTNVYNILYYVDGVLYETVPTVYNAKIVPIADPVKPGYTFLGWNIIDETMPSHDLTIKGYMKANDITVKFYDGYSEGDAGLIKEMFGKCDKPLTVPENPSRNGYTFAGWEPSVPQTYPTEDMSITAKWNPVSFTMNYVDSDETPILSQPVPCGSKVTPPTPSKPGYTFAKWVDETGADVDFDTFTMPAEDVTVKADWTPIKYTITFNTNGGVPESMELITADYGESINPPANPTMEGFTFAGWLDVGTGVIHPTVPTEMPLGGLNLKATWNANTHVAIFNANGGAFADGEPLKTENVAYGDEITVPADPTREGYTFEGWTPQIPQAMPDENVTFTATWAPIQEGPVEYTINVITINPATGDEITTVKTFSAADGETVEIVTVGTDSTADKVHYYELLSDSEGNIPDTDNANNKLSLTVDKNGTNELTVYFKLKTVTVTFDPNGGMFSDGSNDAKVMTGTYGQTFTPPEAPTKTGFNFVGGWDKEDKTFVSDETYTASWEIQKHYAIFTINGEEYKKDLVEYQQPITAPYYKVELGKEFSGWNVDGAVMGTEDRTFDATLSDARYEVSYELLNAPDGAPTKPLPEYANYGDKVPVSTADMTVEGYTFSGWYYKGEVETVIDSMPANNITLTGYYTVNTYNLNFDTDGGDAIPAQQVHYNTPVSILPTPVKEGWQFDGWVYEDDTDVDLPFNMPAKDLTLYAKWTEIAVGEYRITYVFTGDVPAGVTPPASEIAKENQAVTLAEIPAPVEGYTFSGWYYNGKLTESFLMPASDVQIEGRWTMDEVVPDKFALSLDANDGQFADGSNLFVREFEEGEPVLTPGVPTREGFRFNGWVDDNGNPADVPATMPGNIVSLHAVWAELYDVTYMVDGTEYEVLTDAAAQGDPVPATTKGEPTKEGFIFAGWVDNTTETAVTVMPAADLVLKATWTPVIPDTYKLSYYDGSTLLKAEQYAAGADIADYIPDAKMGYTFKGWTGMPADKKMPAEDLVVFADWQVKKHNITLNANHGQFADGTEQFIETDVPYGTKLADVVPDEPTREGYTFDGWLNNDGIPTTIPETMPDINISLIAKWTPNRYTITFDSNGGTPVAPITLPYGEEVTAPENPTREGFIFKGWSPEVPETMPAKDMTLVAQWEAEPATETYTLKYDALGGKFADNSGEKIFELTEGEEIPTVDTPTKDGFDFVKWNGVPADGKMPASDLTITAEWKEVAAKTHKVTYYLVKGGTAYDEKTFEEGETIVNPADPTVEGFTFKGWVDENGNPLPEKMGDKDIEAFAVLEVNKYKVTYIVDGEVYQEYTDVAYGSEVPVPASPAGDETRLFAGWEPTVEAVMPAHDLTYTATWVNVPVEPDEFTAIYYVDGEIYRTYIVKEGETVPVPETPKKFGYKFVGWDPEVPATMPAENLEFEAQFEVDKTFVAVVIGGTVIAGGVIAAIAGMNAAWITAVSIIGGIIVIVGVAELVKHTHTVTYMVDGEVYKTYKVVEGTKIPVPADPEKDGAKFKGWDPEVPERMGNTDLVFEATWEEADGIIDVVIPDTGSAAGIAAFAAISGAAAAAYVIVSKKKKED